MKITRVSSLFPLVLLFVLFLPAAMVGASGNLLLNGDFETLEDGVPVGWMTDAWVKDESSTEFIVKQDGALSGSAFLEIHNKEENHSRWIQQLTVKEHATYRLSGYIRTQGLQSHAAGAHLYVDGFALNYPQMHDTGGEWVYMEYYVKTGAGLKEMTVGASLGGYSQLNAGLAAFDALSVEEVNAVPEGATAFTLNVQDSGDGGEQENGKVSILSAMVYSSLFALLYAALHGKLLSGGDRLAGRRSLIRYLLYGTLAAAFIMRVAIAMQGEGYANDMALFMYWSDMAVQHGISGFYHPNIFVDYPPGYIYVLYMLGLVKDMLGLADGSAAVILLYKLPAIAADLAAALLLYRAASRRVDERTGLFLAIVYCFNPAIVLDSAAWGQVDAIFALALVAALSDFSQQRFRSGSIWYAVAALIKPQAFIFMPVILLALWFNKRWRTVLISAYYGFGTFLLLALPFFWSNGGLVGLFDLYRGTLSSYPYATVNAFNLYSLLGANWTSIEEKWLLLTYSQWGAVFIAAAVALAVYYAFVNRRKLAEDRTFFLAMVLIAVVFILVTKMHERYMFPIMLLSLFAFLQSRDRRMLHLFVGFSITNFINMSYVLAYSSFTTDVPEDGVALVCAIANIALLLYMLYVGYDRYGRGNTSRIEPITPAMRTEADEELLAELTEGASSGRSVTEKLTRRDWLWMGGITLIYLFVALYGLGSAKAPATVWEPAQSGSSFYVDLGEPKQLERIVSFGGVGIGKFRYEFANMPGQWSDPLEVESTHVAVFAWNKQGVDLEARYVKLTAVTSGFSIHEIGIYERGAEQPLPIVGIHSEEAGSAKRGSVEALFDEQELMVRQHSYKYGSYFDEIYHARTAYENLEGIVAYESTHPPLGKLIIALGIKLFGFSPFGWRIAGTMIGVLMLPVIYVTALHLFRRTVWAATATALLAFDFMHFTQTRIATIDVYGVFFIMLMFYFLSKYKSLNFFRDRFIATLLPLGLAGLFFGLGVASKWIVLYGGAGLAIMLALSLADRYKEYAAAKRTLKRRDGGVDESAALQRLVKVFPLYTAATLAVCLVFYIVIPLGIYALSYIPILTVMKDGYTLKALVDYQVNMFNYHSGLVSSHPYSSYWWEWPFMKRPVWYYSGAGLAEGMKSTIVAMGNPLIWWTGIAAILATIPLSLKRKDKAMYMVWIAFLAQYVPWMLVPRETFLYHYFAMVPFFILSVVYIVKVAEEKWRPVGYVRVVYVIAAAVLFLLFYPALSGMTVPASYVNDILRWFPSWVF
ncbi:phospholipid carrier-dependent glycosyltransferase [Paenibacillus chungangensis]|uniref:Polyprenol-phosphate-mannose--protein mannosyltransferase n=1 Tax=Paenibacillus chungangensis TaxID=696535 RepID=A0ABW3HLI1_9BACL